MFRNRLEEVSAWLQTRGENLERNERGYKLRGAASVHARLQVFLSDPPATRVDVQPQQELNLLGWQIVDGLNTMLWKTPVVFREALSVLWTSPLTPTLSLEALP